MSLSVCVASIVVLVESIKFNPLSTEMPLEISAIMIWATVEVNFAIVSGRIFYPFPLYPVAVTLI